jgi:hypothetical protein
MLVWFWFEFPLWLEMVSIFNVVFGHLYFFFWKCSVYFTFPFLYWFIDFGRVSFFELPKYSGYQSFVWYIAGKCFLPLCGWSLQLRDHFFCCAKAFLKLWSPICLSFLLVAELIEFYWESPYLYLMLPEYSLLFHVLTSEFQTDTKVLDQFLSWYFYRVKAWIKFQFFPCV